MSMNDFANHAAEIWKELPTRARSKPAPPSSFSLSSLSSCRVVVVSSWYRHLCRRVVSCRRVLILVVVVASSLRSVVASSSSASSSRCGVFASLAPLYKTLDILTYLLTYLLPARRYASAVLAAALCPSVCPTQVDVLSRRLGGLSWFFLARRLPSTYPTL